MTTSDKETKQLVNAARRLGGKGIPIYLEDAQLIRLCAVVAHDLGKGEHDVSETLGGQEVAS